jgi:hypothetical protein
MAKYSMPLILTIIDSVMLDKIKARKINPKRVSLRYALSSNKNNIMAA